MREYVLTYSDKTKVYNFYVFEKNSVNKSSKPLTGAQVVDTLASKYASKTILDHKPFVTK